MSKAGFGDPIAMWREMIDQWERQFNDAGNSLMKSDEFSATVNRATSVNLQAQKMLGEFMAKYFAALNLPTRDDITALGERLQAVEQALHRLAVAQGGGPQPAASPPRTRKPQPKAAE